MVLSGSFVKGIAVRFARKFLVLVIAGALSISVYAEQRRGEAVLVRPPVSPAVRFSGPWRPAGSGETKVIGSVIDIRQIPVPNASVQLRDLRTGAVIATDETNDLGEYEFLVDAPGGYVVEMILVNNVVLALSNAGSLSRFQTLQTVIQLPGRWDSGSRSMTLPLAPSSFFGIGAASTMTSTTLVMATDSNVRPTDPGEPVSPR